MHYLPLVLLSGLAAAQEIINCNSFGMTDGYQGVKKWRASTKDCAEATNKLEASFGQFVTRARGVDNCAVLEESGDCAVSFCDPSDFYRDIRYEEVWAAARVIHARHKSGGEVAGYVSLDDYTDGFKAFVKVARKGTPDPSGKRKRSLFGRKTALDEMVERITNSTDPRIVARAEEEHWIDTNDTPIPQANGLHTNIQVAWGELEDTFQADRAQEYLINDWRNAADDAGFVRPAGYMAPRNVMIEMEWAAHNNHNIRAINVDELKAVTNYAIHQRQIIGNLGSFAMQVRRGGQSIGHLILRVFRAPANQNVCN